jgi:uncharacterized protein YcsI (UPF0317 family)
MSPRSNAPATRLQHWRCTRFHSVGHSTVGRFHGKVIVSMQPLKARDAARAARLAPDMPGTPLHIGAPEAIGIGQLSLRDYGVRLPVGLDAVPVFWACSVIPQRVLETAHLPLAISGDFGALSLHPKIPFPAAGLWLA